MTGNFRFFSFWGGNPGFSRIYISERIFGKGGLLQMRTDEERIRLLHFRARKLEDRKKARIWGSLSLCLLGALLSAIVTIDVPFQPITGSGFAASSLLGESAGGYVLVAVISFVLAVCITVWCLRKRRTKNDPGLTAVIEYPIRKRNLRSPDSTPV